ncbi:MAG: hypothetical protein F2749_13710 [Actinobacteria bacterium]|nr:hypothetical protein [Actinomycetota bacterium]
MTTGESFAPSVVKWAIPFGVTAKTDAVPEELKLTTCPSDDPPEVPDVEELPLDVCGISTT